MPGSAGEQAEAACRSGRCDRAIEVMEQAILLRPNDSGILHQLGLCYSGCCRAHPLVSASMAVPYLRQSLRWLPAGSEGTRAGILDALGTVLCRCEESPREGALRGAIDCHNHAAEIYESMRMWDHWARTQFNLGNCLCDLGDLTGEDHWGEAVMHYRRALRLRTRESDPERHAAVLENLGTALRRLSLPAGAGNIKESIHCYRLALRIYTVRAYPERNAALQNNLGSAFLSLPESDEETSARNARRALRHFDRALRLCREAGGGKVCGITQYNRAQAYFRLAGMDSALDCLQEAYAAFEASGEHGYARLIRTQLERILSHYHGGGRPE